MDTVSARIRRRQQNLIEDRKSIRNLNDEKILQSILYGEPKGISTKELADMTGLNQQTVSFHCMDLVQQGLITKANKKALYHLTQDAYGYNIIRCNIVKNNLKGKIPKWDVLPDIRRVICKNYEKNSKYKYNDEALMLEFSNRIGAFVTYVLLEASRPGKWVPTLIGRNLNPNASGRNKEQSAIEWIRNIVDPFTLLWPFFKIPLIGKSDFQGTAFLPPSRKVLFPPDYDSLPEDEKNQIDIWYKEVVKDYEDSIAYSRWELDKPSYARLVKAFRKLHPNIYSELKHVEDGLKDEIKRQLSYQSDWKHEKCKGKMKIVHETGSEKIERCQKCKRLFTHKKQQIESLKK